MAFKWILLFVVFLQLENSCSKLKKASDEKIVRTLLSLLESEENILDCNYVVFVHDYHEVELPRYLELLISEHNRVLNSSVSVIATPGSYAIPYASKAFYTIEDNLWGAQSYTPKDNNQSCSLFYFSVYEDFEKTTWYFNSMLRPNLRKDYFILLSEYSGNSTIDEHKLEIAFKEGFENAVSASIDVVEGEVTVKNYCWFCIGENDTVEWYTEETVPTDNVTNWFSKFPTDNYNGYEFAVYSMIYFSRDKIADYALDPGGVPVRFLLLETLEDLFNFTTTSIAPIAKTNLLAALYIRVADMTLLRHMYAQHKVYTIFGRSYPYGFQSTVFTLIPESNRVRLNFFYFRSTFLFLFYFVAIAFFTFGLSIGISRLATRKLIGDRLPIDKLPVFLLPNVEFALPTLPSFRAARVSLIFWFFGLAVLVASYFAAVFNHLTSTNPVDLPQSLEELLVTTTYPIAAPITTTSLHDLSAALLYDDISLVHSEAECWRLARAENFACITLENETPDFGDVFVHKSSESTFLDFHHLNFPVKSILQGKFDAVIIQLWESGFISYWESMWTHRIARLSAKRLFQFGSDLNGTTYYDYRTRYSKLKLGETIGPFYFLTFALALCVGVLLVETKVEQPKLNKIVPMTDDLNEIVTEKQQQRKTQTETDSDGPPREFRYEASSPILSLKSDSEETLTVEVEIESAESDGNRSEDALIQEIERLNVSTEETIEEVQDESEENDETIDYEDEIIRDVELMEDDSERQIGTIEEEEEMGMVTIEDELVEGMRRPSIVSLRRQSIVAASSRRESLETVGSSIHEEINED